MLNKEKIMKEKKQTIKCSECQHCNHFRPWNNTRTEFTCEHPDREYIRLYFAKNRITKMPGFIGFGKAHSNIVPIKSSPAWCPKKKA